jgi:hypothetical protein
MINSHLDFYDDPTGSVLKGRLTSIDAVPDFIKTAERLDATELNKLPDDVFALVAFDGGRKMRKFACVDKGNTALSVIYFMENRDRLPVEAQKTAAANLITACGWYGMAPPAELEKAARGVLRRLKRRLRPRIEGMAEVLDDPGIGAMFRAADRQRAAARGLKRSAGKATPSNILSESVTKRAGMEKSALVGAAMGALTMAQGVSQGHKDYKKRQAAMKAGVPAGEAFKMKAGELTGSQVMPYGRGSEKTAGALKTSVKTVKRLSALNQAQKTLSRSKGMDKKASLDPHVDITGQQPPPQVEKETGRRYALVKEGEARYPIDTAMQVQKAFAYFEKYASRFTPHERHLYCMKVANRAAELGLKVPETIAKYGADTMAKDAGVQIYRRQRMFREGTSEHGLLQEMREKCASIRPEVMAVALEKFDRQNNLDQLWDNGLDDPYYSIFGVEKVAEYSFVDGNDTITEERLKICGRKCKKQVEELFDEDMAEEFAKDPVQIFSSLPLDSKRIMMRVAQQVEE